MRPLKITPDFISTAEGSVLIELGKTRVICTATVNDGVPGFLKGAGKGWVTSEYGMLPRATEERTAREAARGKQSGRTQEIQRLIGRSLRAITDQEALGERTVWLDCDVIEADGGTRTASITGAFVAFALAMERLVAAGILKSSPLIDTVADTSWKFRPPRKDDRFPEARCRICWRWRRREFAVFRNRSAPCSRQDSWREAADHNVFHIKWIPPRNSFWHRLIPANCGNFQPSPRGCAPRWHLPCCLDFLSFRSFRKTR
jgi:hypothetical protein